MKLFRSEVNHIWCLDSESPDASVFLLVSSMNPMMQFYP